MPTITKRGGNPKFSDGSDTVFLNIPYDQGFESLYLAFIAGLCGFGLIPRAVLQIPGSKRRLDRILSLIRRCKISVHDLSRVELDRKRPQTPRFNMPFELGLAVALQRAGDPTHRWYVFEAKAHRVQKSLSDLNGTEIYIHRGKPIGVFQQLANALTRATHRPTVLELQAIYRDLKKAAERIKRELRTKSVFESRAYDDLVVAANASARKHIASLRQNG